MYPCSNPELVAAVSKAGGIGIIQPLSLVFVHGYPFKEGLQYILKLAEGRPVGLNVIVEKSSKKYEQRMKKWVDEAIELGVRFFVTSLGNPRWVVDKAHAAGGFVYHDITERKWAEKALKANVDGLIAVNNRAGGHAGEKSAKDLYAQLEPLGVPIICAGGVSTSQDVKEAFSTGYEGVQLGTRFIASLECNAHKDYKQAIVEATEEDIVLTEKISGVPVSVILTEALKKMGTKAGPIAKLLLRNKKTKHYMRMFYTMLSIFQLKKAHLKGSNYKDYWQAGKSVAGVNQVQSVEEIMAALRVGCGS